VNPNPFSVHKQLGRSFSQIELGDASYKASSSLPQIQKRPGMAATYTSGFGAKKDLAPLRSQGAETLNSTGYASGGAGITAALKSKKKSGSAAKAADGRRIDLSYAHLVDAEKTEYGPGPSALVPLGHDNGFACHVSDMALCSKLRDAYEVGYRGKKRDKPNETEIMLGGIGDHMRIRRVNKVDSISCDSCGRELATAEKPGADFFWYCRRCKRSGCRFEQCMACHALDLLQCEGKFSGHGIHPHFLRCEHRMMVRRQNIEQAYPFSPHLNRILCDLCGDVILGRGASDKVEDTRLSPAAMKAQSQQQSAQQAASKHWIPAEFYSCPRCPEENGLRFELCEHCTMTLQSHGHGVARLETYM